MRTARNSQANPALRYSPLIAALALALAPQAGLASPYTVTNTSDSSGGSCAPSTECSLREAIQAAVTNCASFPSALIRFQIPGTGPFTISPASPYPTLACGTGPLDTVIDGYTQAGSSPNTLATGFDAAIMVRIDGGSFSGFGCGLEAADFGYGGTMTVRGVEVANFTSGFLPALCGSVTVTGSRIVGNAVGIEARDGSVIGGGPAAERNIIGGNLGSGIYAIGDGVVIRGNYIGTGDSGATAAPNGLGIETICSPNLQVIGNVISANQYGGIFGDLDSALVGGNFIGVAADGFSALGNGGHGVEIANGECGSNQSTLWFNTIAHNAGFGITVRDGTGHTINQSSIHQNGDKNIDLDFYGGPLPNDLGPPPDADTGPNDRQNYPEVTSVIHDSGNTEISYTFHSTPLSTFTLDVYRNSIIGTPGGENHLTQLSGVTTDANGVRLGGAIIAGVHHNIAMTATNAAGSTSEFSPAVAFTPTPGVALSTDTLAFGQVVVDDTSASQTATISSTGTAPYEITVIDSTGACYGGPPPPPLCSGEFNCSTTCGFTDTRTSYSLGQSCTFTASFAPVTPGVQSTTVHICDNASGSPRTITLSGEGVPPPPATLDPVGWDFGDVAIGADSTRTFTVTNPSPVAAAMGPIVVGAPFALVPGSDCGTSLGGNAACTFAVRFAPAVPGAAAATASTTVGATLLEAPLAGNGLSAPPSAVTVSPASLDFGTVAVGASSASQAFSVSNPDTRAAASLGSLATTGPFELVSTTCTASLPPAFSCTALVRFSPTAAGPAAGELVVPASTAPGGFATAMLAGTGAAAAAVTLTPSAHDFGDVLAGVNSDPQPFTVANPAAIAATLGAPATTGPFNIASSNCGATLAAGDSCVVNARFLPTGAGAATGSLVVPTSSGTLAAQLVGTGLLRAVLAVSREPIALGTALLGGPALVRRLQLSNRGNAPLTFETLAASPPFGLGEECPASLRPGELCELTVVLDPTAVGEFEGFLTVVTDAVGGSLRIALSALVQARPEPVVQVSPSAIAFGERMAGTPSAPQRITVQNVGGSAASLALALDNPHFLVSGSTCGPVLAAQETCFADVVFQPLGFGPRQTQLVVSSNSPGTPHVVPLAGSGCRPVIFHSSRGSGRLNCAP